MKTQDTEKHKYTAPLIEIIKLDYEISLALESEPPVGPYEGKNDMNNFNQDPYKTTFC
jgi:hypothetical protein